MAATRGDRQALASAESDGAALYDLSHALVTEKALRDCENEGAGQYRVCFNEHPRNVCKTCSDGLDMGRAKPFLVRYAGNHDRHCCCLHPHKAARQWVL